MGRKDYLDIVYNNSFNIDLNDCTFLGQGRSGRVYSIGDDRVIKIFKNEETCVKEYVILESARNSVYFPMVFEVRGNCMIREYVGGIPLASYIKENHLSKKLASNLIQLIMDFKEFGFTRLDIRSAHVFVQADESLKAIDPRGYFTMKISYPYHLLKKLKELKVIKCFMDTLKEVDPSLYKSWRNHV